MKIAQVCPYDFARPGGVKSHIESLSHYLRKQGHEVTIIAPTSDKTIHTDNNTVFFGKTRGLQLGGTKIDVNIVSGHEYRDLKAFLRRQNFDVIHYHTIWNPLIPFQIRYLSKAKNVATFHDTPGSGLFGKIAGSLLMPAAAAVIFRLLDQVISVSPSQAAYITRFSAKEVSIIPNGIDLQLFNDEVNPYQKYGDGMFNLLFLGRLEPRKGLFYALEAYHALKPKHPQLRLLIAGDGNERQAAEKFCREKQLNDVVFLGFVAERDKAALIKRAHVMLAPALYGESFGIVLLEAFACGTPVVGFGNAGYKNIVGGTPYGEFFPEPGDLQTFTQRLDALIEHPQRRDELKLWGFSEAKKYDWKVLTEKVLEVYQK